MSLLTYPDLKNPKWGVGLKQVPVAKLKNDHLLNTLKYLRNRIDTFKENDINRESFDILLQWEEVILEEAQQRKLNVEIIER